MNRLQKLGSFQNIIKGFVCMRIHNFFRTCGQMPSHNVFPLEFTITVLTLETNTRMFCTHMLIQ